MPNAFNATSRVGEAGEQLCLPFIELEYPNFVRTNGKTTCSKYLQKHRGDVIVSLPNEEGVECFEIKTERKNRYGNFFLETWSNRKWFNPGWMFTTNCDKLWYVFLESRELFIIPFSKLRTWAFIGGNIYEWEEKPQREYDQLNDTWGRPVPISLIKEKVGFRRLVL
jgi:hypothetical protein